MILATVTGSLFATRKDPDLEGERLLVVRGEHPDGAPDGPSFLAVDRVDAGPGDRVLVLREGSSARLIFARETIPVQAVVVAVVDRIEVETRERS